MVVVRHHGGIGGVMGWEKAYIGAGDTDLHVVSRVSTLSRFVVMFSAQCAVSKSASSVIFTFYCRNLRPKRWRAALKMCLNGLI